MTKAIEKLPDILATVTKDVSLEFNKQTYTQGQVITVAPEDAQSLKKLRELLSSDEPCIEITQGLEKEVKEPETATQVIDDIAKIQKAKTSKTATKSQASDLTQKTTTTEVNKTT